MRYLIFAGILFILGIFGLLGKRNLVKTLISVELLSTAAAINFVYAFTLGNALGEVLIVLALAADTSVAAIVIGIMMVYRQHYDRVVPREEGESERVET